MEDKDLQIENGNYTRIVNKSLDELVKTPLLGAELAICLFVMRKTYGFNKTEDQISLTQFEKGVARSRPTIVKALKRLKQVNILLLVKTGNSRSMKSLWKFNKYYKTWKLVNTPKLVKVMTPTSKEKLSKLVKTPKHTKDNTKNIIQKKVYTPKENAERFFEGVLILVNGGKVEWLQEMLSQIASRHPETKKGLIWSEVKKFCDYWTERNSTGTRAKWQMQKTFEVDKRLATWFRRVGFGESRQYNTPPKAKGKRIIGLD